MNNMSGSLAQYTQIYWGGEIALYLFLAGLASGAMVVAIILRWSGLCGLNLKSSVSFGKVGQSVGASQGQIYANQPEIGRAHV